MRFFAVKLTATDTPATVFALGGAIFASGGVFERKWQNITKIVIYPESTNNNGANGPARVGGSDVDRVAAGDDGIPNGVQLLPGIRDTDTFGPAGMSGPYSLKEIYLTGETDDTFTFGILTL
jgi:hypothetical protein